MFKELSIKAFETFEEAKSAFKMPYEASIGKSKEKPQELIRSQASKNWTTQPKFHCGRCGS